jgi:predicted methyltransferase
MMTTIEELKAIEDARKAVMDKLIEGPTHEYELNNGDFATLHDLWSLGYVGWCDVKSGDYWWLTEKGYELLGFAVLGEEVGTDPTCEDCEGTGKWAGYDSDTDDPDDQECDLCDGSGVWLWQTSRSTLEWIQEQQD